MPPKRAAKDAAAPKRPLTAYFCFANEARDKIKNEQPGISFTEVSKVLGARWGMLDDKQKSKYQLMADKDKKRYEDAMADYTPPPPPPSAVASAAAATKVSKKIKDPSKPKRPMTGYFFFLGEKRVEIREANPDKKMTEVAKLMGEIWSSMTEEDKRPYMEMADADKERYGQELRDLGNGDH